jgi:conjugal transfer pilus assembly protein TraE
MNHLFFEKNLNFLLFQRNLLVAISLLLGITLILLSSLLFFKSEKVIIVPRVIEKEFWVDSKTVSPTYLEQFGYFLGQLLLNKSSQSAASQRAILLRHADPSYVGMLKQRLMNEEETLQKQNASYVFYPIEVRANPEQLSLLLVGDRQLFVGGKQISSEREGYKLHFSYLGSRLLLKEISAEKKG